MNIYIHLENIIRELDSKLLLASLAASRGHKVLISNIGSIEKGIQWGFLPPGIFHTKSLTPSIKKINLHKSIISKGNLITSIDEEAGLIQNNYEIFVKERFSNETIKDVSAVFCWGRDDAETLKKIHSKHSTKIFKTGSPRVDLWKPFFLKYWSNPQKKLDRPFLLVVSNMSRANFIEPFKNIIKKHKKNDLYKFKPHLFKYTFITASEQYRTMLAFIEAIKFIAEKNKNYDIVLRPHQNEDVESWKIYLEGLPNVYVCREGSVTSWINDSFAVMHNGCTTALEATIRNKPLITYIPNKQELFGNDLPNELGIKVKTKEDLFLKLQYFFDQSKSVKKIDLESSFPDQITRKIHIDQEELAAEKILNIWENLAKDQTNFSKPNKWRLFKLFLKLIKANNIRKKMFTRIYDKEFIYKIDNYKFPPFDIYEINNKIKKFKTVLRIKKEIKCELLSDRTILVR